MEENNGARKQILEGLKFIFLVTGTKVGCTLFIYTKAKCSVLLTNLLLTNLLTDQNKI